MAVTTKRFAALPGVWTKVGTAPLLLINIAAGGVNYQAVAAGEAAGADGVPLTGAVDLDFACDVYISGLGSVGVITKA